MDFRKKSATILFGVMVLGISSSMLVSAIDKTSNFENKTLQIVSDNSIKDDDTLASDLKNENEYSFLYTDNTNRNANSQALGENKTNDELLFIDHTPENKVKSGLSRNVKIALGSACGLSGTVGSIYAVKKFVVDKKASKEGIQNQGNQEQQGNEKKEENLGNNSQGSGTSDTIDENKNGANTQEPISKSSELNSEKVLSSKIISLKGLLGLIIFGVLVTLAIRFKNSESSKEGPYSSKENSEKKVMDKDLILNIGKNLILDKEKTEKEINKTLNDGIGTANFDAIMEVFNLDNVEQAETLNRFVVNKKAKEAAEYLSGIYNERFETFKNSKDSVAEGRSSCINLLRCIKDLVSKIKNVFEGREIQYVDEDLTSMYELGMKIVEWMFDVDRKTAFSFVEAVKDGNSKAAFGILLSYYEAKLKQIKVQKDELENLGISVRKAKELLKKYFSLIEDVEVSDEDFDDYNNKIASLNSRIINLNLEC